MACLHCGRDHETFTRGLCRGCYSRLYRLESLDDYPRTTYRNADLMEELRIAGFREDQPKERQFALLAPRFNMSPSGLKQAYYRRRR